MKLVPGEIYCNLWHLLVVLLTEKHPAPVEVGSLSHCLQGLNISGGAGFLPSTIVLIVHYNFNHLIVECWFGLVVWDSRV